MMTYLLRKFIEKMLHALQFSTIIQHDDRVPWIFQILAMLSSSMFRETGVQIKASLC